MEINKVSVDKISSLLSELKNDRDNLEFEDIIRQGKINRHQFTSLLQYMKTIYKNCIIHEDVLSILFKYQNKQYRYDIKGSNDINIYCKTNNIKTVLKKELINKSWKTAPCLIEDYGMKLNLKYEIDITDEDKVHSIENVLYSLNKLYRFKKRYSFMTEDELFRYDLTVVKSSERESLDLFSSKIFNAEERFEVEMEFIGDGNVNDQVFMKSLFGNHGLVLSALDGDDYLITETKKTMVKTNYMKLCFPEFNNERRGFMNRHFIGPMPITLEMRHLIPDTNTDNMDNILKGYTVTDKADGERHLMYIDTDGHVYLINNRMNIRYTGLVNLNYKNSVLDGEYITRDIFGNPIKLFAIFDIYYENGKQIAHLPLVSKQNEGSSRLKEMNKVAEKGNFHGIKGFDVVVKEFLYSDNIFNDAHYILNKFELNVEKYKTDGLIFTPCELKVGAIQQDGAVQLGGTWMKVLKWKPPHENTIDFLVKVDKNAQGEPLILSTDISLAKSLTLHVGFKRQYTEKITPQKFLLKQITKSDLDAYIQVPFRPPEEIYSNVSKTLVELDMKNSMVCKDNSKIDDNTVVEFSYNIDDKMWKPLRVRKDKTSGNDYLTAVSIWRSINNPVTKDMITGKDKRLPEKKGLDIDNDLYYNRQYSRENSATKPMLDFHNHWVKNISLVGRFAGKVDNVFDIACGKGNDFYKYFKNGFKTVIGVDKSEDNIMNADDGAYSRVLGEMSKLNSCIPKNAKIVYLPMDFSKIIDNKYIENIKDDELSAIIKVLYGIETANGLEDYHNLFGNKFNLVACQFAVHYFMENEQTLNALLTNVSNVLKDGGYFIGTALDGKLVNNAFKLAEKDKLEGRKGGRSIWSIEKRYQLFDDKNSNKNFGLKVDVYMETINQIISEYLVDFDNLEKHLEKYGIRRLNQTECKELGIKDSTGTFGEIYKEMEKHKGDNKYVNSALSMSEDEKRYSFMNRWFIFRKTT